MIDTHFDDATPWMKAARGEIGVAEIVGEKDNPRILDYHMATLLRASDDETPWCSSFINWCFGQVGINGTRSAMARSWKLWGKELAKPRYGCVAVLKRGNNPSQGHVGFFIQMKDGLMDLLSGNQNNQVSVAQFPVSSVVAWVWPKSVK